MKALFMANDDTQLRLHIDNENAALWVGEEHIYQADDISGLPVDSDEVPLDGSLKESLPLTFTADAEEIITTFAINHDGLSGQVFLEEDEHNVAVVNYAIEELEPPFGFFRDHIANDSLRLTL